MISMLTKGKQAWKRFVPTQPQLHTATPERVSGATLSAGHVGPWGLALRRALGLGFQGRASRDLRLSGKQPPASPGQPPRLREASKLTTLQLSLRFRGKPAARQSAGCFKTPSPGRTSAEAPCRDSAQSSAETQPQWLPRGSPPFLPGPQLLCPLRLPGTFPRVSEHYFSPATLSGDNFPYLEPLPASPLTSPSLLVFSPPPGP